MSDTKTKGRPSGTGRVKTTVGELLQRFDGETVLSVSLDATVNELSKLDPIRSISVSYKSFHQEANTLPVEETKVSQEIAQEEVQMTVTP